MRCPTCDVPLDSLRVGEIELDECPRCLGLWFDRGELHAVLTSRMARKMRSEPLESSSASPASRLGKCCRCEGMLMAQQTSGHGLSACARCGGFWVPAATFQALRAQQPANEPSPKERPAPAVALRGRCPACDATMWPQDRQGQGYHRCPRCGGIFLPRGGLTFILEHAPGPFEPGRDVPEALREAAGCPACRRVLQPISWQGRPVRVWACTQCWGTFAPAAAINQLQKPDSGQSPGFSGVGGGLWKMLDAMVEWLVSPPRPPQF